MRTIVVTSYTGPIFAEAPSVPPATACKCRLPPPTKPEPPPPPAPAAPPLTRNRQPELPDKLTLTGHEVAAALSVHWRTVWRWTAAGTFPQPIRHGRCYTRWQRSDIEEWLAGRWKPPTTKGGKP